MKNGDRVRVILGVRPYDLPPWIFTEQGTVVQIGRERLYGRYAIVRFDSGREHGVGATRGEFRLYEDELELVPAGEQEEKEEHNAERTNSVRPRD